MKQVDVALIGYGKWGRVIYSNLTGLPFFRVKYICDKDPMKFSTLTENLLTPELTTDLEKILHDKSISCLFIATPASTHFDIIKLGFIHNKHIFVEKPFVCSTSQAYEIYSEFKMNESHIFIDHTMLFNSQLYNLKSFVRQNQLTPHILDFYRLNPSGGSEVNVLWDLAPHDIALCLDILKEIPDSVLCNGSFQNDKIVSASYGFRYVSGKISRFQCSWCFPDRKRGIELDCDSVTIVLNEIEDNLRFFNNNRDPLEIDIDTNKVSALSDHKPLFNALLEFKSIIELNDYKRSLEQIEMALTVVRLIELLDYSARNKGMEVPFL